MRRRWRSTSRILTRTTSPTETTSLGVITNVTKFGAFVDLGVHQDGLIHISELANEYVQAPSDVVSVGDVVRVKVLEVDLQRRRIAVSRKQA